MRKLFCKSKDPIPKNEKSGVYRIDCGECPATYIGETGRKLSTRFGEHIAAHRNKQSNKSAFAGHLLMSSHSPDNAEVTLVHEENIHNRCLILEAIKIAKLRDPSCNRDLVMNEFIPPVSYTHLTLPTIYSV